MPLALETVGIRDAAEIRKTEVLYILTPVYFLTLIRTANFTP
ncbi:hypothetical protein T06_10213 [Trichinella sp. T6]|nr:hypothetical protein T06_10213 [Trichinella sp. T6]